MVAGPQSLKNGPRFIDVVCVYVCGRNGASEREKPGHPAQQSEGHVAKVCVLALNGGKDPVSCGNWWDFAHHFGVETQSVRNGGSAEALLAGSAQLWPVSTFSLVSCRNPQLAVYYSRRILTTDRKVGPSCLLERPLRIW